MTIKLKAKLPERHGITDRQARAGELLVAVVGLEPLSVTHYEDGSDPDYTFGVAFIEALEGSDADQAAAMRLTAYRARTGEVPLPLEAE